MSDGSAWYRFATPRRLVAAAATGTGLALLIRASGVPMAGRGARLLPFATLGMLAALTSRVDGTLVVFSLPVCAGLLVWVSRREVALPGRTEVLALVATITVVSGWLQFDPAATVPITLGTVVVMVAPLASRLAAPAVLVAVVVGTLCIGSAGILDPSHNDVILAHDAAASRVLAGNSPYRDLGVVETNPANLGAPIEGYSYVPSALVVFGLAGRLVGGADTVTLLLWAGVVLLAGWRYGARSIAVSGLALVPGLPLSVAYGWTEVLALLLVLGALSLGGTRRAAMLGVALASKQYLVVALPGLVAAWWNRCRWLAAASATAALVTAPLLLDVTGAWAALVEFHLHRPLRPDSANLAGFLSGRLGVQSWPVPSVLVVAVSGIVGLQVARRHGELGWLHGMLASLVVTLAIGPAALLNYWLLVMGLAVLVVGEAERAREHLVVVHVPEAVADADQLLLPVGATRS